MVTTKYKSIERLNIQRPKIHSQIIEICKITENEKFEMFTLFEKYYSDVNYDQFLSDISEKTHAFIFRDSKTKNIIGFSTIFRKKLPHVAPGVFLFSGDTVISEEYWGRKFLQVAFFRYILMSKLKAPYSPVYWMLMSKGVKTYLMMRNNFKNSWPQYSIAPPKKILNALDEFYSWKFGSAYSKEKNIVRFESSKGAVREEFALPTNEQIKNPEVSFFLNANSTYQLGTELACIAEIRYGDFTGHLKKYFLKKGLRN